MRPTMMTVTAGLLAIALLGAVSPAHAQKELLGVFAFPPTFLGGVFVATCPDATGRLWVVVGSGPGAPPAVHVFSLPAGSAGLVGPHEFFAYDPAFAGGVRVACSVVGDQLYITTGAGEGGGPHVRVFRVTLAP